MGAESDLNNLQQNQFYADPDWQMVLRDRANKHAASLAYAVFSIEMDDPDSPLHCRDLFDLDGQREKLKRRLSATADAFMENLVSELDAERKARAE